MQKQFPKILITFFFLIFVFQLAGLIFLLTVPKASQAEEKKVYFVPQVGIGDDFKKGDSKLVGNSTEMIGKYIKAIYKYAIGIVGILAAVVLMFGGVKWLIAGGNAERIGDAKSWIGASLTGLVLTLASYTILYTVNPDLVNFKITTVGDVGEIETIIVGCCETSESTCESATSTEACKEIRVTATYKQQLVCYQNIICLSSDKVYCTGKHTGVSCTTAKGEKGYCGIDKICLECKGWDAQCSEEFLVNFDYECCGYNNGKCEDGTCQ